MSHTKPNVHVYEPAASGAGKKILGGFFIALALVILGTVVYKNSGKQNQTIVYSVTYMLNGLWSSYKRHYVEASTGRTLDPQRQNATTSEGQSYTMLRAVWQDDKATFDSSWQWTSKNLQHNKDNLFSWLYGQKPDGSYAVLTGQGGQNSASDADSDIALALIFASSRWHDPAYQDQAKKILNDIWKNEVVTISGTPYMAADNLEKSSNASVLINPSYLSPASYKIFAQTDPNHNWNGVADSSYKVISQSMKMNSSGLPPDWVQMSTLTGGLEPASQNVYGSNFSYDAMRIPFHLALDWQWNHDSRDRQILQSMEFLDNQWQSDQTLYADYNPDGSTSSKIEAPAMYGGTLGYFMAQDPQAASQIYQNKLSDLYNPDAEDFKQQLGYYDSNWAWFGLALYNNRLVNLYQNK